MKCLAYRCRFEHFDRCAMTEKQFAVAARWSNLERHALPAHRQGGAPVTEVVKERGADVVREWQPERVACLVLRDAQACRPPLHIIKRELHDFARAQAV